MPSLPMMAYPGDDDGNEVNGDETSSISIDDKIVGPLQTHFPSSKTWRFLGSLIIIFLFSIFEISDVPKWQ